jgi:CheY-like chemotaxis protein
MGNVTLIADSGKQALKFYQQNSSFSIILTDLNMPEMDGIELNEIY